MAVHYILMADHYISSEGLQRLKDELAERQTKTRRAIAESISTAKDQGDLSENFEYQDAKERQAQNETQIIALRDQIARAIIVDKKSGGDTITVGASFTAKREGGDEKHFELVGAAESDPLAGKISSDSPMGKAFLGKAIGENAEVEAPSGLIIYTVISID